MSTATQVRDPLVRLPEWVVAVAVAVLISVAGLVQLFRGPDLGLMDNNDWRRVLCGAGLQWAPRDVASSEVVFRVGPLTDPDSIGCGSASVRYASSQTVLLVAVRGVSSVLGGSGLDLRWVGGTVCVLIGLALAALYLALPGRRTARLVAVAVAATLLLDVAYAHYYSTAYSEAAGFVGVLCTTAALAWAARHPFRPWPLVALLAATTVLVTAKSQLTPMAGLVIGAVLLRAWQDRAAAPRPLRRPIVLVGAFVGALTAGSGLYLAYQGDDFARANHHNLVLYTVAPLTDDPTAALADMDLDPSMAAYSGSHAYATEAIDDPAYPAFYASVSRLEVAAFLVRNPDIAWEMVDVGLTEATDPRTPYLAELRTAERDAGQMAADRYAPASDLLEQVRPAAAPVLLTGWAAMIAWGLLLSLRGSLRGADLRAWGVVVTFAALAAPAQVLICLLGDGFFELAKHEVFVSYLTWLAAALTLGSVVQVVGAGRTRATPRSEPGRDEADADTSVPAGPTAS